MFRGVIILLWKFKDTTFGAHLIVRWSCVSTCHRAHSCLNGSSCLLQNQKDLQHRKKSHKQVRGEWREGEQGEEEGEKARRERRR